MKEKEYFSLAFMTIMHLTICNINIPTSHILSLRWSDVPGERVRSEMQGYTLAI